MADPDEHLPASVALGRVVGALALTATWLLAVAGRSRWSVALAATVAAFSLGAAAIAARRWTGRSGGEGSSGHVAASDHDRPASPVDHMSDVLVRIGDDRRITVVGAGPRSVLGGDPAAWVGRPAAELVAVDDRPLLDDALDGIERAGGAVELEIGVLDESGDQRRATMIVSRPGADDAGGFVATVRDVTEQRRLERRLGHRAFHDDLTGLAGRALFLDRVEHVLRADSDVAGAALLFVDLDDFKMVNDELGHAAGDVVLRTVAERIAAWVRPTDSVARLGGDEFAVLLTDVDPRSARHVAEQIAEQVAAPVEVAGRPVRPGASIGVAHAQPGTTAAAVLADADVAMYRAKRAGGGRVHLFDPAVGSTTTSAWSAELSGAPERGELRLVYLPEIDLHSGRVVGVEALVRWDHPHRGVLHASDFLDEAERSGDIELIGNWAIEQALTEAAGWGADPPIAINVASTQLDARDLVARVTDLSRRWEVAASSVTVEVPEPALTGSTARERTIRGLRELGCHIAVDGFAAEACPLQRVLDVDATRIKLAPSLSASIDSDERARALVRSIVAWGDTVGITTVAVAIERPTQLEIVRELGCDVGQGHLLAPVADAGAIGARGRRSAS